jgi:hypothetical protein
MEDLVKCPVCHLEVRPTDYFCFNCGKNLKPKPPSTSGVQQLVVYLESIFLPPYGIIIGIRYLRQKESKAKVVGSIAVILTIVSIIVFTKMTMNLINNINTQVNNQLQQFEGF